MDTRATVLFVGHSNARRLGEFVRRGGGNGRRVCRNFNVERASVHFYGVGGARVKDLTSPAMVRKVRQVKPDTLVVMIGDNDRVHACDVEELSANIVASASYFHHAMNVPRICVTQLLPRCTGDRSCVLYDKNAFLVNSEIKAQIKDIEYMHFVQFDFARFEQENPVRFATLSRYYRHGVHLTEQGYYRMYKVFRSVVIRAVAALAAE